MGSMTEVEAVTRPPSSLRALTGGEVVAKLLSSLGVQYVFGVPGGQTLAINDAIRAEPGLEFVTVRHEGAAAVMADAYGRLTRTPGVCLATTGPGATNLLTGVGGALRDSSPMLVLTCNNNSVDLGKDDAQNADHVALFSSLTKSSRLVVSPAAIPQAIEESYLLAISGNPGPAHIDFSRDAIEGEVEFSAPPAPHPLLRWARQRPRADFDLTQEAFGRIVAARHPVLWLGSGVSRSEAGPAALALAEAMSIPVVTTFNGIDTVPMTHPLVFGVQSRMGTALSSRVLAEADLVVAIGNGLNAISTGRWKLQLPEVVQINIDPLTLGRYYSASTLGLVGDARSVLEDLLEIWRDRERVDVDHSTSQVPSERSGWIAALQAARELWWAETNPGAGEQPAGAGLSPPDVIRALRGAAPDDTLLIADAGNVGVWSYCWQTRGFGGYLKPVGFGNMGFALPAAIAATLVDNDRPILALVGDGSLGMTMAELETLGRIGGPVCVVVLNDSGYGNIRQEQEMKYAGRTTGVDYSDTDYATVAAALGVHAERVGDLATLAARAGEALGTSRVPLLLDVPIDRGVNAWTFPLFLPHDPEEG